MDVGVDGKVLLVTGGTQGIGRAIALQAARARAEGVMITGRNSKRGAAVAAEIEALGVEAGFVDAALDDPDAPMMIVQATLDRFGQIDGLVNAAAVTDRGSIAEADIDFFDRMFAVNTRAPMFLMQELIHHLRERREPGAIVNILSVNAHGGTADLGVYSASKAALAVMTKNAAYSHRYDRVRVNGILLGWADTPGERDMQALTLGKGEGWLAEAEAGQPWGRLIKPEDVARLALFLLSDASIPMTGALIDQQQDYVLGVRD
ncbi:SDR family oxidoreductase [Kaistia dalseonensis]|uniref:NAD(P)-dependent dehydrogenase (Short-subunit alcohol dehydrogenase family) n=1 Tax=Kaistia dalseonensis TaxID=410840 RepID=A0ABU0HDM0_9HYPH|nr:SDR family oxidoreductase [Kaistia dalseonensis]MCX5497775.1 SDR family oxidoreductase [Kaistia dalseonensis]MDQ0440419.1 NAD(P)-dependent dehydrogenase (short-subunit alcohol dehydrogenase family) [Kaistia dalseonensis]